MPSSPLLSSMARGLSCGLLEVRFALTMSSFLIITLFWAQVPLLGFVALGLLCSVLLLTLLRIALLARYKPTRLYDIEPTEDSAREQQGGPRVGAMDLTAALNLNPTHLRLAMMDRDFTPNDYELLLGLDEEVRAMQFTGIPQPLIERLPTFPVPQRKTTAGDDSSSSVASTSSMSSSSSSVGIGSSTPGDDDDAPASEMVCAICLEEKRPGEMIRMLPCLHSSHTQHTAHTTLACTQQQPQCTSLEREGRGCRLFLLCRAVCAAVQVPRRDVHRPMAAADCGLPRVQVLVAPLVLSLLALLHAAKPSIARPALSTPPSAPSLHHAHMPHDDTDR